MPMLLHSSRLQILVLLAQHIPLWKLIEDPCPLYGRRFYRGDRLVHRCRAPLLCLGRLVWRLPLKCTPQDSEKLQACQKWGSCPAADGSGLQCQDLPRLKEASMNWETKLLRPNLARNLSLGVSSSRTHEFSPVPCCTWGVSAKSRSALRLLSRMRRLTASWCSLENALERTTTTPEISPVCAKYPNLSRVPLPADRMTRLVLLCPASVGEAMRFGVARTICAMGRKSDSMLGEVCCVDCLLQVLGVPPVGGGRGHGLLYMNTERQFSHKKGAQWTRWKYRCSFRSLLPLCPSQEQENLRTALTFSSVSFGGKASEP